MSVDLCELTGRDKEHLIQKCLPIQDVKGELKFPLLASEKIDGVFCIARDIPKSENSTDVVAIYSRTGEIYTSMEHLKPELKEILILSDSDYLIFEAYAEDVKESVISGWCRDTKNQHTELKAYVHDCLTEEEFKRESDLSYESRREYLEYAFKNTEAHNITLAVNMMVSNEKEVYEQATNIWSYGGEGLVLRDPNAAYQPGKRNESMIKVKKILSYDLLVVDVEEGKGKYTNHVGKLICKWQDNKTIKVGTGLTDTERKTWWSDRSRIIGKIVQVNAMTISTKGILREPRYKGIRYDKTEGDY